MHDIHLDVSDKIYSISFDWEKLQKIFFHRAGLKKTANIRR